jgi:hypothetical protein
MIVTAPAARRMKKIARGVRNAEAMRTRLTTKDEPRRTR